ncbi:pseudouridine-5'-phosphate glycosidase [Leptolyngbya sp. 7M]|uniref:pseudouridine-5'-phosphate glycosidase n=1 Tax=Leptolyngbya sp. 7M TaxID=2812896 RepID=UPI001B8C310C|nr:pseudouridine-5'-phosphate glycosidase [Leptolyngbya sp. 7M]QYO67449.1 pseudouridine-5'-phosphate glycosidase [Leptolyngbya sp. 7M]
MKITFSEEVSGAIHFDSPIVALESTVIAHGLPYPQNIETAYKMERIVRELGAVPAMTAIFDGEIYVGLGESQIERLATGKDISKVSVRDLPVVTARRMTGATTVASTSLIAFRAGIRVFATGGIGGVHRGNGNDISADLPILASTPIAVVCSGAKSVLDLPATREWLETYGITVLGYRCDEMPAFYTQKSGLPVDQRVETSKEVVKIVEARSEMGMNQAVLVTVPVPEKHALSAAEVDRALAEALQSADQNGLWGRDVTPFLLAELAERTEGRTLQANISLLENNARVAAEIAKKLD